MYQSTNQKANARRLRKEATPEERRLWSALKKRQLCDCRFRRQYAIGAYIVDFECFEKKLIVELDGGQHNTPDARSQDSMRRQYLEQQGYRVLRFWNFELNNHFEAVLEAIAAKLGERSPGLPHPGPPPEGEVDR